MLATVIIVSYRTPELTVRAARCASAAGADQVVVIDNASGDSTLEALRAAQIPRVTVMESAMNEGFGGASNSAEAATSGDVVIFVNSDAELDSQSLGRLTTAVNALEGRVVVGPRLRSPDGTIQRSAGLLPKPFDLSVRALGLHWMAQWLLRWPALRAVVRRAPLVAEYESAETATHPIGTSMVSGACFAIGREAFEELGGFDERFFMYFEDADLCRRAAAAGMPIRYVPDAVVTHIGGASSSEDYHFGPLHARAMRQYLGKWYGPGGSALAIVLLWLRAIGFSVTLRPQARRAWRALWAAVRDEDPRR